LSNLVGQSDDPKTMVTESLHVINDAALRVVMVMETSNYLKRLEANQFSIFTQKIHKSVAKTLKHFEGSAIKIDDNTYLASFKSVTNAVLCALKIQSNFKYVTPKFDIDNRRLKIGLCDGYRDTDRDRSFEKAISRATQMCEVVKDQLVISSEVKALYESENRHARIDKELIRTLRPHEERFLDRLMEFCEKNWKSPHLSVGAFSSNLGYSPSQLYRKLKSLTDKSPNRFIREFRLHKALRLLHQKFGNITEIALEAGFHSPSYFSKCFSEKFGILPSKYAKQHCDW